MPRYTVTVVELKDRAPSTLSGAVGAQSSVEETTVFAQTFDDLNLRTFVRQLNVTPRRRKTKTP